ncbi:hypothetical protein GCM10023322_76600 [Rugosimonospora acidiphila]|uniref:Uncharacterized protein n=1 Tax=Rugosimonospora acidiphila TaxID=556531 RepID=A0ABP9SNY5_9ACTN
MPAKVTASVPDAEEPPALPLPFTPTLHAASTVAAARTDTTRVTGDLRIPFMTSTDPIYVSAARVPPRAGCES